MASADLIMKLRGQDDLSKTIKGVKAELSDTEKKALKLDLIKKEFDRIKDSSMPLKRQLRQIKGLLGEMNMQGLDKNDLFKSMTQQAGEMSDAMGDANQAVAAFAKDTMNLEASAQALQLVAGGASLVTGAMGLLGVEDEKVQQAMLKVQSAISLVNGVTAIANVLNKDSILMLRIKKIMMDANTASTAGNTVAEGANAAATGISTVARNAWNVTVAIGKALLGDFSGLVLVAAAGLVTYALCTDDSTDSQEKHNKAVSDGQKIEQDYSNKVSSSTGELVGKYQVLRREWLLLKTTAEKTKWIENNQSAMDNLGLSVNIYQMRKMYLFQTLQGLLQHWRHVQRLRQHNRHWSTRTRNIINRKTVTILQQVITITKSKQVIRLIRMKQKRQDSAREMVRVGLNIL